MVASQDNKRKGLGGVRGRKGEGRTRVVRIVLKWLGS